MSRLLIVTLALFTTTACYSEVYQWTDTNGTVHFSDQPQPGASIVTIKNNDISSNTAPSDEAKPTDATAPTAASPAAILPTTAAPNAAGTANAAPTTAPTNPANSAAATKSGASTTAVTATAKKPHIYNSIKIAKPEEQANYWNNGATVDVVAALEPALMEGDRVQLIIDGKAAGEPQATAILQATGLTRGAHTVQIQVIGADGKILGSSASVTFYMHLSTVKQTGGA